MNISFRMFSKFKGYRRLKEERTEDEEKKYQDYKDNWTKKGAGKGCSLNEGYSQDKKKMKLPMLSTIMALVSLALSKR